MCLEHVECLICCFLSLGWLERFGFLWFGLVLGETRKNGRFEYKYLSVCVIDFDMRLGSTIGEILVFLPLIFAIAN